MGGMMRVEGRWAAPADRWCLGAGRWAGLGSHQHPRQPVSQLPPKLLRALRIRIPVTLASPALSPNLQERKESVLVSAHTSAGKTVVAE